MKTVFLVQCVLMELKLDNEILDDLLYISRLSVDEKQKRHEISEAALRGNEIVKQLDTQDLKKNSSEFLDGYFRVPKVLE